jgi:hypothetical protein
MDLHSLKLKHVLVGVLVWVVLAYAIGSLCQLCLLAISRLFRHSDFGGALVVAVSLGWILCGLPLCVLGVPHYLERQAEIRRILALTFVERESEVARIPVAYLHMIGSDDPAVVRFQELVQNSDFESLHKEWRAISQRFRRLERQSRYRGSPLMQSYFAWYGLRLRLLCEGRFASPSKFRW